MPLGTNMEEENNNKLDKIFTLVINNIKAIRNFIMTDIMEDPLVEKYFPFYNF